MHVNNKFSAAILILQTLRSSANRKNTRKDCDAADNNRKTLFNPKSTGLFAPSTAKLEDIVKINLDILESVNFQG